MIPQSLWVKGNYSNTKISVKHTDLQINKNIISSEINILSFSGWVPAGIVVKSGSIETEEFYAGYMSRIEAAEKLKAEKEKGNFVVRKNQKHQFYWWVTFYHLSILWQKTFWIHLPRNINPRRLSVKLKVEKGTV